MDETDDFDPMAGSVADMLALADREAAETREERTGVDLRVELRERDAGMDGTIIVAAPAAGCDAGGSAGEGAARGDDGSPAAEEEDGTAAAAAALASGAAPGPAHPAARPPPDDGSRRPASSPPFAPVCDPVDDALLNSLLLYAPLALNFIYATSATDMQLLAAQQGWRLLYAHLEQDADGGGGGGGGGSHSAAGGAGGAGAAGASVTDRPASALFAHDGRGVACFAVRGTATINDVVTDIRALPVPFPPESEEFADRGAGGGGRGGGEGEGKDGEGGGGGGGDYDDWTPVFRGQGLALCGMAGASVNLFRENVDALLLLARRGYKIRFVGHSLGGGVAALLGSLVRRHFERRVQRGNEGLRHAAEGASASAAAAATTTAAGRDTPRTAPGVGANGGGAKGNPYSAENLESNDLLRVYSYGSPACVDAALADYARSYVTNCVLHDDVVPRLNPTSIRALLKHLLHIRETWVKAHLTDDVAAYAERARGVWAPRWRQSFTLLKSQSRSGLRTCQRKLRRKVSGAYRRGVAAALMEGGSASAAPSKREDVSTECGGRGRDGDAAKEEKRNDDDGGDDGGLDDADPPSRKESSNLEESSTIQSSVDGDNSSDVAEAADAGQGGVAFDGDLFYEAEENLLESDDEGGGGEPREKKGDAPASPPRGAAEEDEWVPFDEPAMAPKGAGNGTTPNEKSTKPGGGDPSKTEAPEAEESGSSPAAPAVVLDETPLPRMFVPGKIVHVYTHRGAYRAAFVPRQFRELRRISLAGNMLTDHTSAAYYEGLLEVKTVRRAEFELPEWTGFGEESTCSCCASRFTWASTSDSEAQEARDKHNCRACGGLVCDPCSRNRISLPSFGINSAARVCDRCYNDMGSILMGGGGGHNGGGVMERSFVGMYPVTVERNYCAPRQRGGGETADGTGGGGSSTVPKFRGGEAKPIGAKGKRQKRSSVVDELASRIPTVPTC